MTTKAILIIIFFWHTLLFAVYRSTINWLINWLLNPKYRFESGRPIGLVTPNGQSLQKILTLINWLLLLSGWAIKQMVFRLLNYIKSQQTLTAEQKEYQTNNNIFGQEKNITLKLCLFAYAKNTNTFYHFLTQRKGHIGQKKTILGVRCYLLDLL